MVGFKDTPTVVSSPGGNVEEVGGGVEKSESRKYRKVRLGGLCSLWDEEVFI
jgi:hypothetical protein